MTRPTIDELESEIVSLLAERDLLGRKKDGAYEERNRLVALLAAIFPSKRTKTEIEGWDPEWHNCVYIDLPTGQASWHYPDSHAELFSHVPEIHVDWDGHSTEEKYCRVAETIARLEAGGGDEDWAFNALCKYLERLDYPHKISPNRVML